MKKRYIAALAVGGALSFAGGGFIGAQLADDGNSKVTYSIGEIHPEASSTTKAGQFVIGCVAMRPTPKDCYSGHKWEDALKTIQKATAHNKEVKRTCKTTKGAWRIGYCLLTEDDHTARTLETSDWGIAARARLVL